MISILIPTYNYACYRLVCDLHRQCLQQQRRESAFAFEILVADDASTLDAPKKENEQIAALPYCRYLPLAENVGRSRIRNLLADAARYDYLLFLDSDAEVADAAFLQNYLQAVRVPQPPDVVCGGVANIPRLTDPACSLRFYYEEHVGKARLASERMKNPCARFTTFNFLIRRSLFLAIRFNEQCVHYGYEDVFFGMELDRRGTVILHIDNPLIHAGVERNEVFLAKTETALRTLHSLDGDFQRYVTVSRMALRLHHLHMAGVLSFCYRCLASRIRKNLLSAKPSIFLFNLYKLGYYLTLDRPS